MTRLSFAANVLCPLWGLSEFGLTLFKRSKANAASKDHNSLRWIWAVNLAAAFLGICLAFILQTWALPAQAQFYVAGCCLFILGLFLRWYSIFYLGRFFTVNVAIASDHRLITSGPYRFVRHPSYTGGLTTVLGLALCVGNFASLLIMVVPSFCVSARRMRIEEEVLLGAFGEQYRTYMQATKRLIPFIY